jgi:hypothetical protein
MKTGRPRTEEHIIAATRLLATAAIAAVLATTTAALSPGPAAAAPTGWTLDLHPTGADANVTAARGELALANAQAPALASRTAIGSLISPARRLPTATSLIRATVDAQTPAGGSVRIDVRGQRPDGDWTEWVPAGQQLPVPARTVQARVTLIGGTGGTTPRVHAVTLQPGPVSATPQAARPASSYRVFATREGLVGGTTADGHVITSRDHFVALPSGRGLAPKATGDYTVRICAQSGRCEWAPVWDVGPWNIDDDYWSPAATRQNWTDVAQGKPEAQAAYSEGYNNGKDGFGRTVSNPAGIDLADGTFWDGLALTDNSWVTVTYLWTATASITGVVHTGLNVRTGPHGTATAIGLADEDAQVPIVCQAQGDSVDGSVKKTDLWDELATGYYVSDAYVQTTSTGQVAPSC